MAVASESAWSVEWSWVAASACCEAREAMVDVEESVVRFLECRVASEELNAASLRRSCVALGDDVSMALEYT